MRKQSIQAALKNAAIRRALNGLSGCAVGGWPETRERLRDLDDAIPHRDERSYTIHELIAYALTERFDRYEWRAEVV